MLQTTAKRSSARSLAAPTSRRQSPIGRGAAALLGLGLWLHPGPAPAESPTTWSCGLVEDNAIHVDGLTSDWDGVGPTLLRVDAAEGASPKTLGVKLRCNYDQKAVYLLVEVDDDILLRSSAAPPTEDHIELQFGVPEKKGGTLRVDTLALYPGNYQAQQKRVVRWSAKKAPKVAEGEGPAGNKRKGKDTAFEIYDVLQQRGYAIELRLPKKLIPGFHPGAPLRLNVRVVDSDSPKGDKSAVAELSPSEPADALAVLEFEEGQGSVADLLKDLKLDSGDVYFDKTADLGDGAGRILMAGKFLAFAAQGSAYQEVAVQRSDIKEVQLVELDKKHQAIALRISEQGGGGSREVLRLFTMAGGRFQPIFAAEVQKLQGDKKLVSTVSFERHGGGTAIVFSPQPAVGFSAATYSELPAEDVVPILLPWQDKRVRYVYKGGKYTKE